MKHPVSSSKILRTLCAEPGPEDGLRPRSRRVRNLTDDNKLRQLCGQIRKILTASLTGVAADDLLASLVVEEVQPHPDASRLRVLVAPQPGAPPLEAPAVLAALAAAAPALRAEVAATIHRRRTPEFHFQLRQETGGTP